MEEIDIRKMLVTELQTEKGEDVISVYTQPDQSYCIVIHTDKFGQYVADTQVLPNGFTNTSGGKIIRKKKKVLYIKTLEQLLSAGATIEGAMTEKYGSSGLVDVLGVRVHLKDKVQGFHYDLFGKKSPFALIGDGCENIFYEEREE